MLSRSSDFAAIVSKYKYFVHLLASKCEKEILLRDSDPHEKSLEDRAKINRDHLRSSVFK